MNNTVALPLGPLRRPIERAPLGGACLAGGLLGVFSSVATTLVVTALQRVLPAAMWGPSAAAALGSMSDTALFFLAVVWMPLMETAVGQVLPIEPARRLGAGPALCVLASALVFGGGHGANGGLLHGVSAFLGGLIFAYGYVALRPHGFWPGFAAAATAHATHNAMLLLVMARFFPA